MIRVVDYAAGNLASVANALAQVGADFEITHDPAKLAAATGVILPGVGAAPGAMRSLEARGLVEALRKTNAPLLGICLGMQLLFENSEEGDVACLGVIPGKIRKFSAPVPKIPHMGWNRAQFLPAGKGLGDAGNEHYYFANSFYAPIDGSTIAVTDAGIRFASAVRSKNFWGVQFHPEKSGESGLQLLRKFVALCR